MVGMVGVTSGRASPGVSSLTVGLAWALRQRSINPLVVEADHSGGVLGQRLGLPPQPSLSSMVRDARRGFDPKMIFDNSVQYEGVWYLQAPVDPVVAEAAVDGFANLLGSGSLDLNTPSLVDLGRSSKSRAWEKMVAAVDNTLVVTTPYLEDVQSSRFTLRRIAELGGSAQLVVVGDQPHSPQEVADSLGVGLLGGIVHDSEIASVFRGGGFDQSKFKKSLLGRSIDGLASRLLGGPR